MLHAAARGAASLNRARLALREVLAPQRPALMKMAW